MLFVGGEMERRGMKGRIYKEWWFGKEDGVGGVGVMVKEELCEKVVEVRRVSDRVMTVVVVEEDVLRLISWYAPQSGRSLEENQKNQMSFSRHDHPLSSTHDHNNNTICHSQLINSFIQTQHEHQICRSFFVFDVYSTHCSHHGSFCPS